MKKYTRKNRTMPQEPDWSKSIENSTVCFWFYILAVVNGVFAVVAILATLYLIRLGKSNVGSLLTMLLAGGIGFTNTWFLFLVCNRGLKNEGFYGRKLNRLKRAGWAGLGAAATVAEILA